MKPFITIWSRIRLTAGPRDAAGRDRTRVRVRCTSAQRWPRRPSCNTAPCRWSAPHWPDRRRSHDQSTTRTRPGARCPRRRGPGLLRPQRRRWGRRGGVRLLRHPPGLVGQPHSGRDDRAGRRGLCGGRRLGHHLHRTGEWNGYWDKLATQTAGGDLPDVIQMDEKYISEYGGRGALLDLAEAGLDTSDFAEGAVEVGELADEGLMAINAGLNAAVFLVNPAVFEEAGVELPDDTTWTWDDLIDIATEISENTEDGTYGMTQMATIQALFQVWMRQLGQDQYRDGGVGFDAEAATSLMEYAQRIEDTGAGPDASTSVEDAAQSLDQSLFAADRIGITVAWSNPEVAHDAAVPGGITVPRPPSLTASAADAQL